MSRSWIAKEGRKWVSERIITPEQYERLVSLYPERKFGIGILPILGGLLVGLGVLTFVAANWQEIAHGLRLAIIIAVMCGLYGLGAWMRGKGYDRIGEAFVGAGLLSFGAGIFLVAQMYHLTSNSELSFLVWGVAGLLLTWMLSSRFLYVLTLIIFVVAQIYSTLSLDFYSYASVLLTLFGLGSVVWMRRTFLESFMLAGALWVHTLIWLSQMEWYYLTIYMLFAVMYLFADAVPSSGAVKALRVFALGAAFLYGIWVILIEDSFLFRLESPEWNVVWYLLAFALVVIASVLLKGKQGRLLSAAEWLVLLPLFFLPVGAAGYASLAALALFALYLLLNGYRLQNKQYVLTGTVSFIFSTLVAYGKLTWAFMDKSLFFISAGLLLLALSWFLYRRNKAVLDGQEGGAEDV